MKKLKPGVYSHLVSGDICLYETTECTTCSTYSDDIIEVEMDDDKDGMTPGFPFRFGSIDDHPEIWQWIGEL